MLPSFLKRFIIDGYVWYSVVLLFGYALIVVLVPHRQAGVIWCLSRATGRFIDTMTSRPGWAYLLLFVLSLMSFVGLNPSERFRVPIVNDEFGYLLTADTFARGRLSNPPAPSPAHVQSIHILSEPAYIGKYPPGQSLFLAAGQVAFGPPMFGVWIPLALANVVFYWALLAWMPRRWAFGAALVNAVHPVIWFWSATYWGGGPQFLAGCWLLGGIKYRLDGRSGWHYPFLSGCGIGLLAITRPAEGLYTVLACAIYAGFRLFRDRRISMPRLVRRDLPLVVLPVLLVLAFLGAYNHAVTGSPFHLPYRVYIERWDSVNMFLLEPPPREKTYPNPAMAQYYRGERAMIYGEGPLLQKRLTRWDAFVNDCLHYIARSFLLHIGFLIAMVALCLGAVFRHRRPRRWYRILTEATSIWAMVCLATVFNTYTNPHYVAQYNVLLMVGSVTGLRLLSAVRVPGRARVGSLMPTVVLPLLALLYLRANVAPLPQQADTPNFRWARYRADIEAKYRAEDGCHLLFVRYPADHRRDWEWVYNHANLTEGAKVLWLHELGPKPDQVVRRLYPSCDTWLVQTHENQPPEVFPYP